MVTGTGLGAAREKKTPDKSMRVAGPGATTEGTFAATAVGLEKAATDE